MKKTIYLKPILLLFTLLLGVVSAHAEDYDYEWVKVTDHSQVESGTVVLLVDESKNIALPSNDDSFKGVPVTISDGKIADDNIDNIKWTLTKNSDGSYTFQTGDLLLAYTSGLNYLALNNDPNRSSFLYNNGVLGIDANPRIYSIKWEKTDDIYSATFGQNDSNSADLTFFKRQKKTYVKWKKIGNGIPINDNDTIAIVDLNTESALSNDKGDKAPDAVAVTLNDDKDRIIMDEVPGKVQWTYTNVAWRGVYFTTKEGQKLYVDVDKKELKVGDTEENYFFTSESTPDSYLYTSIDETKYYLGVEESMFSSSWKLVKEDNDIAKNPQTAIFKKVVDPQKVVTIELAEYYNIDNDVISYTDINPTITGADVSEINWSSSDPSVASVDNNGHVSSYKRGTVTITATVTETEYHDKASAKCTVVVDEATSEVPGSMLNPFTVKQAKDLAENGKVTIDNVEYTLQEGVTYYIKGKVSKVNSGLMAMFGDMDFGEMMGGSGGMDFDDMMDDMDFDMDSMDDMGFDMSSLGFDMSSLFGSSDKVTYYISDDGTKDNQLKVLNGCGEIKSGGSSAIEFKEMPKLSPGDCVVVRGPLVYTEDTSMFSSLMGGGDDEPKKSAKVDEMNYLAIYDPTLLVEDKEIYVNKTLDGSVTNPLDGNSLYTIDNEFNLLNTEQKITNDMQVQAPTYKSSDEEIAKWDEDTKQIIGVQEGTAKITVKVKVIVTPDDESTTDTNEEKSYTMKRKFKLTVKTRDLDPAGYYDGDYVLTTSVGDLKDGTRLLLVGTRVKDDNKTDYVMGENSSMMGGGKSGSKIDIEDPDKKKIPCEDVPKGTLEVVLEKADDSSWYLNVGEDENGNKLYLYASVKEKTEESGTEGSGSGGGSSGFNFDEMMEMFMPSSGLKVGTKAGTVSKTEGVDSLKATITISGKIATIKFPAIADEDDKNTIVLTSSFDMGSMMNMFGGNEDENEGGNEGGDEGGTGTSTFDMGSFDMFMASFNTKKPADIDDTKDFLLCIYRFVPDPTFDIAISSTAEWRTIVTYKDVALPVNVDAYEVVRVVQGQGENVSKAILKNIEYRKLKGGEPYLLHSTNTADSFTLTVLTDEESEDLSTVLTTEQSDDSYQKNILLVSTRKTSGEDGNTSVYVLADKNKGVGFYKWTGGELGKGRVYLPVDVNQASANDFYSFFENDNQPDAIMEIDRSILNDAPYYDLQGRRVKTLTKGIYIVNGHKVIIK